MRLVFRWWWLLWKDSPIFLAQIVLLSVGSAVLLTAFPWLWQYAIERLDQPPEALREVAGWMVAAAVGQWLLYMVLQGSRSVMNATIQWRARQRVFDHLTELDPSFFRRWRTGDLVTRLYDDAGDKISWFLCSGVFRAFEALLIVVSSLSAMLWLDWRLTLWVAAPLPVLIALQAVAQTELGRRYLAVQRSISAINDQLATTFEGIRVVQATGLAPTVAEGFAERAAVQRDAEVHVARIQQGVFLLYGFGWQLAMVSLLLAGGEAVIEGSVTLGQFVTFEGLVMTLVWPMFDFGMFVSKVMQARVALDRLQELMDEPVPEDRWGTGSPDDASLSARGVAVRAEDGATLIEDLDLELAPGERIAIVGEVGSGKSTAMALLAGMRQPTAGSLLLGGHPRSQLDRATARRAVALVPQDPVLPSTSLRETILLGREVDEAVFERALTVSRLAQDLPALPQGLETRVGERGVTLSGGQQQRVAIARALVGDPAILLLDDATAALDADTEAAFWEALDRSLPHVSTVVVTHRLATIEQADRILVLEGGRVVQRGRHAELIAAEGPYQRIYGRIEAKARLA
ncbi:MAG: ABC transporter ATP-binding protein [Deltaproteobacteria bacterium]|nr:MAG: ABC transporter ATP-binding protein [Deltaproteobacteria bacterium]